VVFSDAEKRLPQALKQKSYVPADAEDKTSKNPNPTSEPKSPLQSNKLNTKES
jgi:hypothetical protein